MTQQGFSSRRVQAPEGVCLGAQIGGRTMQQNEADGPPSPRLRRPGWAAPMQEDRPNESAGLIAHEADGIRTRNHRIDSPEL